MKPIKYACVGIVVVMLFFALVPFISFGAPYAEVVSKAAKLYGIDANEYSVEFVHDLKDNGGNSVYGLHSMTMTSNGTFHTIKIKENSLRSMKVATIFHEFAHAAQDKYHLDMGDLNREQHAEVLSFDTMWHNGFWWDAIHVLMSHTFFAKPHEYRATSTLWSIAVSF